MTKDAGMCSYVENTQHSLTLVISVCFCVFLAQAHSSLTFSIRQLVLCFSDIINLVLSHCRFTYAS